MALPSSPLTVGQMADVGAAEAVGEMSRSSVFAAARMSTEVNS